MTECNGRRLMFSSLGRQRVVADFGGGRLTSDAGALLLREVDRRLGLVDALAAPLMAAPQTQFEASNQKVRNFHELEYAAKTWDRKRRLILKAEQLPGGANPRFVVTNLPAAAQFGAAQSGAAQPGAARGYTPAQVYDELYTQRGEMEYRIKEQQLGLFADRTSCHAFVANQFRLLHSSAAYVLVETHRRTALAGTELEQAQANTIRLKLFKVAARVVTSVRRVVLHLSSAYPLQDLFARVLERLLPGRNPRPAPA